MWIKKHDILRDCGEIANNKINKSMGICSDGRLKGSKGACRASLVSGVEDGNVLRAPARCGHSLVSGLKASTTSVFWGNSCMHSWLNSLSVT